MANIDEQIRSIGAEIDKLKSERDKAQGQIDYFLSKLKELGFNEKSAKARIAAIEKEIASVEKVIDDKLDEADAILSEEL